NGSFSYTAPANFAGDDWFSYTVSDGDAHSSTAWVVIHVTNNAPVVNESIAYYVVHDHTLTVPDYYHSGVLNGYASDDDGDTLTVVALDDDPDEVGVAHPTTEGGSITMQADGSYVYTPPANWTGDDTLTFTVSDSITTVTRTL